MAQSDLAKSPPYQQLITQAWRWLIFSTVGVLFGLAMMPDRAMASGIMSDELLITETICNPTCRTVIWKDEFLLETGLVETATPFSIGVSGIRDGATFLKFNEPASEGGGISDELEVTVKTDPTTRLTTLNVLFRSGAENTLPGIPSNTFPATGTIKSIDETGLLQDVTSEVGLSATLFSVFVMSDVTPVPEPASLLLLGSGLAGLAAWRRRKAA